MTRVNMGPSPVTSRGCSQIVTQAGMSYGYADQAPAGSELGAVIQFGDAEDLQYLGIHHPMILTGEVHVLFTHALNQC